MRLACGAVEEAERDVECGPARLDVILDAFGVEDVRLADTNAGLCSKFVEAEAAQVPLRGLELPLDLLSDRLSRAFLAQTG